VGAGFHSPGVVLVLVEGCLAWSGHLRQALQAGQAGGDEVDVRCVRGQVQPGPAGVMGDAAGDGEQSQAESFGFPHPGVFAGEREHLHPRGQLGGQHDDRDPDLIL
jgi:hypothetical protein